MSFLNFFAKKRPAPRGFQTKKTASKFQKTFILEPILTPSGIVDGGDDAPDLVMLEPPAELLEDVDFPEMENDLVGDAPDLKVSDGEEISFFTPETETELTGDESVEDTAKELPLFDGNDYIPTFESGVFAVGDSGEVSFDFLFDGGRWEGEVAIFSLEGMDEFEPGSEGFIQEAASRALSDSELGHVVISDTTEGARFSGSLGEFYGGQEADWNEGDYRGVKTFSMRPGDEFGIMLVPKGTVEAVLDNPGIEGYQRPLFSMVTANPDDAFHVGQIADVTGDGSTFVMEDWRVDDGSDFDYNDIIFQVKGATAQAPLMDSLIDPENDWRDLPVGRAIVDYVLPEPAQVEFDFPEENQPLIGVIDTGFSGDNPDLDYDRIILGRDRVEGDDNPLLPSTPDDESVTKEPTTPQNDEHGTHVLGTIGATQDNGIGIDGVNDDAPLWVGRAIGSGRWADSLAEFVDAFRESEQPNAVVNLSLDLTQINPDGSETTRYEFTPQERAAIEYARQHNVLIVVAAGNDGGVMSILGQASQEFDNIITVGSSDGLDRADYSSYGYGLDILAPGGTTEYPVLSTTGDGVGTMAGTSVATSRVTGAASQVWAANPQLHYRQVIEVLKATATDLKTPGWDAETGAGLLNLAAAVNLARTTTPMDYEVPATLIPETWSGEGKVTPSERAVNYPIVTEPFDGWVGPDIGVNLRNSPRHEDRGPRNEPYRRTLNFDAWTYGERVTDIWLGQPDELWYRVAGTNYWVPSAYIYGYPDSRPPVLAPVQPQPQPQPEPQPQPQPIPQVPIDPSSSNYRDGAVNPFAYNWIGQCTWYAYGRMLETGLLPAGARAEGWFLGNAESWRRDAERAGLPVTSAPTAGARGLVVWPPGVQGGDSKYGHVAFLEEVYPDGRIRISESNWAGRGISERTLTPAQYSGLSFVRLENATPNPQFSSPPATPGQLREYRVRPGDTLWGIAQRELGDGNRWREIQKPGGGTFTEAEAQQLRVGQSVYLPVSYQTGSGTPVTPSPSPETPAYTVSEAGLRFIAGHEGLRLRLYNDPAGHCTIGVGHLVHRGNCNGSEPAEFRAGISEQRAYDMLRADANVAVQAVKNLVRVPLNQQQFDALVSFTFNLGVGSLQRSDLLQRLNAGEYSAVPYELSRWVKGGNVTLPGLVRRRNEEGILFRDGIYTGVTNPPTTVTPPPSSTPSPTGNINWVNFSGMVGPSIGVNLRNSTRFSDRSSRNEPKEKRLEFDAWVYGEVGTDIWLGTPDARWFKIKGTNLWVPSAYINGNPPNSSPMPGSGAVGSITLEGTPIRV